MKRVSALLLTCTLGLSALSGCSAGDDLRRGDDAL